MVVLFAALPVFAQNAGLSWNPSPDSDIAGYKLYYGVESPPYDTVIDLGNHTSYTVNGLLPGTYYFAVTAYDTSGIESAFSNTVSLTMDAPCAASGLLNVTGTPVARAIATVATVGWYTTVPATSQLEYGTTAAYGSLTAPNMDVILSHNQALTGLLPGTTYHYRIRSKDAAGDLTISGDMTFTTPQQSNTQTMQTIVFPRTVVTTGADRDFTGLALANLDTTAALLTFTAYDPSGNLITGTNITNPAIRILGPGEQLPVLDTELFGLNLPAGTPGWIRVDSTVSKVSGFFLNFDQSLTMVDSALGCFQPLGGAVLPEINDPGFTTIAAVNSGSSAANASFMLLRSDGTSLGSVVRTIPPRGVLIADAHADLFPGIKPDASTYIRSSASQPLSYFELRGTGQGERSALNGQNPASGANTLYAPQYVVGGEYRSTLSVVNVDPVPGSVSFRLIGDDGAQIGMTRILPISGLGKIRISDPNFFVDSSNGAWQGYVEIKCSTARLTGSVTFADTISGRFSPALPLVSALGNTLIFSHVASDATYFTGLAVLNPGMTDTMAAIDLFDASGNLTSTTSVLIPAGQRVSQLLTQYFPDLVGQSRDSGYIRIRSANGVAAFALFGTNGLSMLAAIPAQLAQ